MEILKTENYELFQTIKGNRTVNFKKVEKLQTDIQNGLDLTPYAPLIVYAQSDVLKIIDGQHRFLACKELGKPIYYVKCNELSLQQIARINSRSDKWSNKDFLDCYKNLGISDYVYLQDFLSKYKIIYSASIDLLMYGSCKTRENGMERFRDGEFKVNFREEVIELVELTKDLFGRYKFWNDRYLITAVQEIKKAGKCDFDRLKEKIKAAPNEMEKQGTWKSYALNIERVYNHRNSIRQTII